MAFSLIAHAATIAWYLLTLSPPGAVDPHGAVDPQGSPLVLIWLMQDEIACRIAKQMGNAGLCLRGTEKEAGGNHGAGIGKNEINQGLQHVGQGP